MKKDYKLTVRVDEDEYKIIKLKAELSGLSMSRFLTEKAKNCYVEGYAKAKKEFEDKEKKLEQIEGQIRMD